MKWVYMTIALNQPTAETWTETLRSEGIPTRFKPEDAVSFLGVSAMPCRPLVPEGRVGEARAVLAQYWEEGT